MKYKIEIRNDRGLVKVKGPYRSRTAAEGAIAQNRAKGWIPSGFWTEITEWDTPHRCLDERVSTGLKQK